MSKDNLDIVKIEEAILQKEEDMKAWCPSSGENVGRMIESSATDNWYIACPTCGVRWAGGSTVLSDHTRPGYR
ncbi:MULTISPECIES: hypothetical protein [Arthrobacter]|uniref:hypothetical protein n=1 Tax=unclassified Arthrobacter TaxID=235627 RepID=UPI0024BBC2DB|nr:hypothetical protein [Arthrobacter sp. H35-MC1]MDJ0317630.1 hypothetical protein [Arthrobacter sp. H35-MC1]